MANLVASISKFWISLSLSSNSSWCWEFKDFKFSMSLELNFSFSFSLIFSLLSASFLFVDTELPNLSFNKSNRSWDLKGSKW